MIESRKQQTNFKISMSSPEIDPRYEASEIYCICSSATDKIYIGSTYIGRKKRMQKHLCDKRCSSHEVMEHGNYDITRICFYPCNNRTELELEERRWILQFREEGYEVVNEKMPGAVAAAGGMAEYKAAKYQKNKAAISEQCKKYYEENKEAIKERVKKWSNENKEKAAESRKKHYAENKETFAEKQKKYRAENKEAIAERKKKYRDANKEVIAAKSKKRYAENKEAHVKYKKNLPKFECECCGNCFIKENLKRHKTSAKYQQNMASKV